MKKVWGDLAIEHIGDLVNHDFPRLLGAFKADHAEKEKP